MTRLTLLLFAVSKDANPLHGFNEHLFQVGPAPGDFLDFDKIGYNADAVFLTATDESTPDHDHVVIAIDKASILGPSPTFVSYVSLPPVHDLSFFIPAEMHGAQPGCRSTSCRTEALWMPLVTTSTS